MPITTEIHPTQLRALFAMLRQQGVDTGNKPVRLAYVNGYRLAHGLPRVESFNHMTAEEAAQLQRALSQITDSQ